MTEDEREALIREVRMTLSSVASHGPSALTSTHDPMRTADLLSRLAKALEASPREPPEPEITDEVREAAFAEAWGFRAKTRPYGEQLHTEGWFNRGWRAALKAAPRESVEGKNHD